MKGETPIIGDEVSRSQRSLSASSASSQELIDATISSKADDIFPLLDEMTRVSPQKQNMEWLVLLVVFVQMMVSATFNFDFGEWEKNEIGSKIIRGILYVADFGATDFDVFDTKILQIVIICVTFLIFIWFFSLFMYYRVAKTFPNGAIFVSRFFSSFLNHIILIPTFYSISCEFNILFDTDSNASDITLFVFLVFSGIFSSTIFIIDSVMRSSTCYLENTFSVQWDGNIYVLTHFLVCFSVFFARIMKYFREWAKYALIAVYILITGFYIINTLINLPFIRLKMNECFISCLFQMCFSALFSVIPMPDIARFILSIVIFFFALLVFKILNYFKFKLYKGFDNAEKTDVNILRILRIMIQEKPEEFVQWRYIRSMHIYSDIESSGTSSYSVSTSTFVRVAQLLSFFPSEPQLLNHFISIISKHSDLSFDERFLFYQIKRIHILRQSSATKQSNFDYSEMQKATNRMTQAISGFFLRAMDKNQELSLDVLTGYYLENQHTNGICLELLSKYPNSSRLTYNYSRYLIECRADFLQGAQQFFKAEAMEKGGHIAVDYAFRSMVNLFPQYLKKEILDFRGRNILNKQKLNRGDSSTSSSQTSSMSLGDQWEEINEEQSSRVFSKPKLRFALRRAIDNIRSRYLFSLQILSLVKAVIIIIASALFLGLSPMIFSSRDNTCALIKQVSQMEESYSVGLLSMARLWSDTLGISPTQEDINNILGFDENMEDSLFPIDQPLMLLEQTVIEGYKSIQNLGQYLANLATTDAHLTELSLPFVVEGKINYCTDEGVPLSSSSGSSQRGSLSYLFSQLLTMRRLQSIPAGDWPKQRSICEIAANLQTMFDAFSNQINEYTNDEQSKKDELDEIFFWLNIFFPICLFLLLLIPSLIYFILFYNEVEDFFENIMLTPKETFYEASKPISLRKSDSENDTGSASIEPVGYPKVLLPFVFVVNSLIVTAMYAFLFVIFRQINTDYNNLSHWAQLSAIRTPATIRTLGLTYLSSILQTIGDSNYLTNRAALAYLTITINESLTAHKKLTVESTDFQTMNNFNDEIDSLTYDSACTSGVGEVGLHANYNCLSTDLLTYSFTKLASDMIVEISTGASVGVNLLHSESFIQFQHLICYHLFPKLQQIHDSIISSADSLTGDLKNGVYLTMIISIVAAVLFFVIEEVIERILQLSFNVFKIFIARIPPSQIISNQGLHDLIIGKKKSSRIQQLSAGHAVINSSPDAIFALSSELTIEVMNPAASTTFGYTPEQLLGQSLVTLIPMNSTSASTSKSSSGTSTNESDPNNKLYRQASLMKANQAAMTYSCHVTGVKDDGTEISLFVTLLGLDHGQSFALIANDQTAMIKQQKQVEEAKKSAEQLLNNILPPMIVQKMNAGETDISFTVNCATIFFIDIAKFSEYSASLTARQIMQNLGRLFRRYDETMTKYPNLLKIKLIGDDYMAAAGLFNPELPPEEHATDVINFCLEALRALDETNEALEANLNVRIGVNTGGPLIAGVLGIDKPLFDIIGDPINVAARLQSTDIENHIQISEGTYNLIKDKGFNVHERGKIYLKGKGEQTTYIIDPPESLKLVYLHQQIEKSKQEQEQIENAKKQQQQQENKENTKEEPKPTTQENENLSSQQQHNDEQKNEDN